MPEQPRNIVVVGGGSAGWLAACYLAATQSPKAVTVTLIESPNIPTLGVGEGTWPSMRNTLSTIGIPEAQFLSSCNASFKQGSKFVGWRNDQDSYYHPFMVPSGYNEINLAAQWQNFMPTTNYDHALSPQPMVCEQSLAPKQLATPDYAYVTNYGYHFDAGQLTKLLTEHGTKKLGVHHIIDDVTAVNTHPNSHIKVLECKSTSPVEGDLFIDCSGMKSLLLSQHYGIAWQNVDHILLNNSALAAQVPYQDEQAPIQSTTIATAQQHGWTWDIGLYHRRGVGLSYASDFTSSQQAQDTLANYLDSTGVNSQDLDFRELSFSPGYRDKFWHKNCLAIGMSAGFIEPLEASALAMVELSLNMLTEEFPQNSEHMEIVAKRFNQRFSYRWQRVIDFVKLHYVLSERNEPYWLAQRAEETIPEQLREWLTLWQYQSPSRHDFIENEEIFSSSSYQYVLYGMGYKTQFSDSAISQKDQAIFQHLQTEQQQHQQKLLSALPSNRAYLSQLHQQLVHYRSKL